LPLEGRGDGVAPAPKVGECEAREHEVQECSYC
jgi:hypothetical protein